MSPVDGSVRQAELALVEEDLRWGLSVVVDLTTSLPDIGSLGALCFLSQLSLLVTESERYLRRTDPSRLDWLGAHDQAAVVRARHRTKLFADTAYGVEGTVAYFAGPLADAHRATFTGNARFRWARWLESDLGLRTYSGRLVYSTHGAHYLSGTAPDMIAGDPGPALRDLGKDLGRYFSALAGGPGRAVPTFVAALDPGLLRHRDVRSDPFYARSFGGGVEPGVAAALTTFRSVLNTLDVLLPAGPRCATEVKLTYLTLYHVLLSLERLRPRRGLGAVVPPALDRLLTNSFVVRLLDPAGRWFRNTLVHYGFDSHLPTGVVDPASPLAGLVGHYFPGHDIGTLDLAVRRCLSEVASALDACAGS